MHQGFSSQEFWFVKEGSPATLQHLAAATQLPTGSQEDEQQEGGEEDTDPEDSKHAHILIRNKI